MLEGAVKKLKDILPSSKGINFERLSWQRKSYAECKNIVKRKVYLI